MMTQSDKAKTYSPPDDQGRRIRDRLAGKIRGRGLEIGAFTRPTRLRAAVAQAIYVDCVDAETVRRVSPEYEDERLVAPDVLVPGETLKGIDDASQDFVISSHVLEHMEDPLGALSEWHRVLVPGGDLFLAIPDMRFTFDRTRPRTTLAHLIQDHEDGGRGSRESHIREFGRAHHELKKEKDLRDFVKLVDENDYKVHFHVWIPDDVLEAVRYTDTHMGLGWELDEMVEMDYEAILLLRRSAA
ncbi:MAG: class I SAM-dependent methyltransferase [Planctomycetota bacterium]|nr:class I SAM-dependent methyltransferase [Planctomycetota bacterium]